MVRTAPSVCPPRRVAAGLLAAGLVTAMVASSTTYAASSVAAPESGAAGIGDPYFPLDGNGGIDVVEYDIHDRYRFGQRRLSGWTLLTVRATRDLLRFNPDLLLPVRTVKVDGAPARHDKANKHELQVTPATPILSGTRFRVRVVYAGYSERIAWRGERNCLADHDRAEREQLHQGGGVSPTPGLVGDTMAVDGDRETAQQVDLYAHLASPPNTPTRPYAWRRCSPGLMIRLSAGAPTGT